MHVFKIICGDRITHINAKTRAEAIEKFAEMTGAPKWFLKENCTIKNVGKVGDDERKPV